MIFLGIDASASHKPYCYVALDSECHLLVIGQGRLEDLLAFISGQTSARIAVNAPKEKSAASDQETLFPIPAASVAESGFRAADFELKKMGVIRKSARSPQVKRGQAIYGYLEQMGYQFYPAGNATCQVLETSAEAAYLRLNEHTLYDYRSLEGRMQRQMILYQQGLRVINPMDFFEEITPHRLAQGLLPLQQIYSPYELNAWVAAYLAYLAERKPARVACLGNETEGQIFLPVKAVDERS